MHIGYVTHLDPSQLFDLLNPQDAKSAKNLKGRTNTPLCLILPALLKAGHRVSVFSSEPCVAEATELRGENLTIYLVPHRKMPILPWLTHYRTERRRLVEVIQQVKPDLVHGQWTHTGHSLAALESGFPAVCTIRDTVFRYAWEGRSLHPITILYQFFYIISGLRVIRTARHLIAASNYTARHIRRYFAYRSALDVVPNPVVFAESLLKLKKHDVDPSAPVFMDIAGWGRLKNVKTLLRAFAKVRNKIPAAKLILYGAGLGQDEAGHRWAQRRGFAKQVEFRGFAPKEELSRTLVCEADIFVHLSAVETFGNTIVEAVASGNPAVIGDHGAVPDVLKWHNSCRYVRPRNVKEATKAMMDVVANYLECSEQLNGLRERFREEYAPDNIVRQLVKIYTKILEEGQ